MLRCLALPCRLRSPPLPSAVQSPRRRAALPRPWDPVGAYITAGQDEPGYRSWYLAAPSRGTQVKAFNDYLSRRGRRRPADLAVAAHRDLVAGMRRAPFEVPPSTNGRTSSRRCAISAIMSFRRWGRSNRFGLPQPGAQHCAGGAPESAHKHDSAIDMVPLEPITREALMRTLCGDPFASTAPPTMPASASTLSCGFTSTAPSFAAGTWTRRSPRNARRCCTRRTRRGAASRSAATGTGRAFRCNAPTLPIVSPSRSERANRASVAVTVPCVAVATPYRPREKRGYDDGF